MVGRELTCRVLSELSDMAVHNIRIVGRYDGGMDMPHLFLDVRYEDRL